MSGRGPHEGAQVLRRGAELKDAKGAVVLLHGRGGSAQDILALGEALGGRLLPEVAWLAPQAAGNTWYPQSFLAPREQNEPWLSSALDVVRHTVGQAMEAGVPAEKIVIGGFSQGACLSTEFVAQHPRRYGALLAFTGGLIGEQLEESYPGKLDGMPAMFFSGDPDPHVPWSRVEESVRVLQGMGAEVGARRYAGRPHTITAEEVQIAGELLHGVFG